MAQPRLSRSGSRSRAAPKPLPQAGKKWKVGIIGFGTVGRSVAKLLARDTSGPLILTHICNRNIEKKKVPGLPGHILWTESADTVLSSDVDIVVELIGGLEPSGEWIRRALRDGKSVVTANKHLMSESGPELMELARKVGNFSRSRSRIGAGARWHCWMMDSLSMKLDGRSDAIRVR